MSVARARAATFSSPSHNRDRSTSTASSSGSSSSQGSIEQSRSPQNAQNPQSPASPRKEEKQRRRSNSLRNFFSVREPSALAFEQMAQAQQKELAQKGLKVPFGVPVEKMPVDRRDKDYKQGKERAKERAKVHDLIKERIRLQEEHDRALAQVRAKRHASTKELTEMEADMNKLRIQMNHQPVGASPIGPPDPASLLPPPSRRAPRLRKSPSLDSLPETGTIGSVSSSSARSTQKTPTTPPAGSTGLFSSVPDKARKLVAPWEEPGA